MSEDDEEVERRKKLRKLNADIPFDFTESKSAAYTDVQTSPGYTLCPKCKIAFSSNEYWNHKCVREG